MNNIIKQNYRNAFTIVELLIVVVVVAILATIAIVSYSGIQKQAIRSSVKSALSSASTAMKLEAVKTQSFSSIPSTVSPPDKVGLALTELPPPSSSDTSFCMNGTYAGHNDVAYHTTESNNIEEGLCEGDVLPDTVVGEYNYEAAGGTAPEDLGYTPITIGTASADLYGFNITTNLEWTSVTLSWDSQPGVQRYEVQTADAALPNAVHWNYRLLTTGGGSSSYSSSTYSGQVPGATTSLIWTDTSRAVPRSTGQSYSYRMRPCTGSSQATCSEWTEMVLSNPIQDVSRVPEVRGFTVTPAPDWSSVTLSWDGAPRYSANMSATRYEIQTANVASPSQSQWDYRLITTGGGSSSYSPSSTSYSGQIPANTTSLVWTDTTRAVPRSVGQTYNYRIRNCASSAQTYCGEWSAVILANPTQSSSQIPDVSGFTVTPAPDWSSVTLSWIQADSYTTYMPATRYEVQTASVASPIESQWGYRLITTGGGSSSYSTEGYSGQIPANTTSLVWTDTTRAVPYAGQTYNYRIRNCANSSQAFCGSWQTRPLSR